MSTAVGPKQLRETAEKRERIPGETPRESMRRERSEGNPRESGNKTRCTGTIAIS